MRILIQLLVLLAVPVAAHADFIVPEPETLSLLGIGAAAMLWSTMRGKK